MTKISPIVKWVGGKRQLLPQLLPLVPDDYEVYAEPFAGGLALMLALQPKKAIINDYNEELMNLYTQVRDNVDLLIEDLKKHKNTSEYFYEIRGLDRDPDVYSCLSDIEKASRMIYIIKTSFNGLYRKNRKGQLNASYCEYKNPNIVNEDGLRALSDYFNENDIKFFCGDFEDALKNVPSGSFVYLDPPYDGTYTGYTECGFDRASQIRLRECCDELDANGIKFMLSNSDTEFIREQYKDYDFTIVEAIRKINCKSDGRGKINEVVVRNYQ